MKKLKCESCGGNIEINNSDQEFATCPYCNTKYQLNETKKIYIKLDDNTKEIIEKGIKNTKKISTIVAIPAIIIIFVVIIIFIIIFTNINKQISINNNEDYIDNNNNNNNIENTIDNIKNKINQSAFNNQFEIYSGSKSKLFIESLLDNIVTNNKKNKNMLITVIYNDYNTTNEDTIITIKHSLENNKKYEVIFDYDEDGYINKITLKDI